MSSYARALSVGTDENEEDALERFQSALAPIDVVRVTGRAAAALDDEEGDEGLENPAIDPDAPYVPASDDPIDNPFVTGCVPNKDEGSVAWHPTELPLLRPENRGIPDHFDRSRSPRSGKVAFRSRLHDTLAMGKIVPFRPRGSVKNEPTGETTRFEGPSHIHARDWGSRFALSVAWLAERSSTPPLVRGEGTILLGGMTTDASGKPFALSHCVGQMTVLKACLATGEDLQAAIAAESERHARLAKDVFDRYRFSEAFETWCEQEHGQHPLEDPLFLVNLRLDRRVLDDLAGDRAETRPVPLDEWVAALAAIDALAVLGAVGSPLLAFDHATRACKDTPWLQTLGARRWRPDVLVAFRPDP